MTERAPGCQCSTPWALTGSLLLSGPDSPSAEVGLGAAGSGKMKLVISEGMLRGAVKSPAVL